MCRACVCFCTLACACLCVRALCVCAGPSVHMCVALSPRKVLVDPPPLPCQPVGHAQTNTHSNCRGGGLRLITSPPLPCVLQAMCTRTAMCVYDSVPRVGCVGPVRVFLHSCVCVFVCSCPMRMCGGQVCTCVCGPLPTQSPCRCPPPIPCQPVGCQRADTHSRGGV